MGILPSLKKNIKLICHVYHGRGIMLAIGMGRYIYSCH